MMTVTTTIFGMIISHMELQCIVYMTVGLDFLSTGPNWTSPEVPGHLQGSAMLHVVLLVPSLGRSTHCCWWEVDGVMVSSKTCGCWMLTEECGVRLVYDELYQECMLYIAYIHVDVCLESLATVPVSVYTKCT